MIKTDELIQSLHKINSCLGSDSHFPLEEASRILSYIESPLHGPSDSYPSVGKVSNDLMTIAADLVFFGDIDLKSTTSTFKKILTRALHPVVKLYSGIH